MPVAKPHRQVQLAELGELVKRKRDAEKLTLRAAEAQLDHTISASSLSRIEHGAMPEARNVPRLARWLAIPLEHVAWPAESREDPTPLDTPAAVEVHLRADRNLHPQAAKALADTFRTLYDSVTAGQLTLKERKRKR